jgi:predicted transposase YdaD
LLPFAPLTRSDSPQGLLAQVAQKVATIEDRQQRANLASCTGLLAGLRFDKSLIRQLLREEVMRESVIYQDILQQGRQQEILSVVMRLLNQRLGHLNSSLSERIQDLSTEQLEALVEALFNITQIADLVAWLEQQEALSFCQKLLARRFGELDSTVWERVQQLSVEQLEALGRALFELNQVADLITWLERQEQN